MNSSGRVSPRRRAPKWLIPALGYIVSVICLIWVYQGFDWRAELPKLFATDWKWVAVAVVCDVSVYIVQAWRWNLILEPIERVSFLRSVQAIYIGLFGNEVLPLRSGEVIRCYVQAKWNALPLSVVISSAIIERLIDGVWLAFGFWVASQYVEVPGYMVTGAQILAVGVMVLAVLLAIAVVHKKHAHAAVAGSRWARVLWHVVEGSHDMGRSPSFIYAIVVSFFYLALQVGPVYALARGFGLDLTLGQSIVVLIILRIGSIPPQAPSNVGAFQFFTIVGVSLFGVPRDDATAYATLLFVVVTLPLWLLGFGSVLGTKMRIQDLHHRANRQMAKNKRKPSDAPPDDTMF